MQDESLIIEKLNDYLIVDIQAVDTRYTKQWKEHPPPNCAPATNNEVVVISGGDTSATTSGAFPNFGGTNVYKSKQLEQIGEMSRNGEAPRMAIIFYILMSESHSYTTTLHGRAIGC